MATLVDRIPGYSSTYQDTYRSSRELFPNLPPLKYHQAVALEVRDNSYQLQPRYFPLIPSGPRRVVEKAPALGPGLGTNVNTERYLDRKPITQTLPPRQVTIKPPPVLLTRRRSAKRPKSAAKNGKNAPAQSGSKIPSHIIDALCNHVAWVSTTRMTTEEGKLPMNRVEAPKTTFEENSDMVRLRPVKKEPSAAPWQKVAVVWDRAQMRAATVTKTPSVPDMEEIQLSPKSSGCLTPSRRSSKETISVEDNITELIRNGRLNTFYERPRPGYAGFIPRSPVDTTLQKQVPQRLMETEMKASYRPLPDSEVKIQKYAHKGPLSRTVTLTSPYNPFNKVEERQL